MGELKERPNLGRPGTSSPALATEFTIRARCQVPCCPVIVMAAEGTGVTAGRGSEEWGLVGLVGLRGTEGGENVSSREALLCPRVVCVRV